MLPFSSLSGLRPSNLSASFLVVPVLFHGPALAVHRLGHLSCCRELDRSPPWLWSWLPKSQYPSTTSWGPGRWFLLLTSSWFCIYMEHGIGVKFISRYGHPHVTHDLSVVGRREARPWGGLFVISLLYSMQTSCNKIRSACACICMCLLPTCTFKSTFII